MGLPVRALPAVALAGAALAGCGADSDDFANEPRPAAPIVVSAAILNDEVAVSPQRFGAGLVNFVVTNQTGEKRRLQIETDELAGAEAGVARRATTPIVPSGTAQLKANLRQGTYRLSVDGDGVDAVRVRVGPPRESAQDKLLLP